MTTTKMMEPHCVKLQANQTIVIPVRFLEFLGYKRDDENAELEMQCAFSTKHGKFVYMALKGA